MEWNITPKRLLIFTCVFYFIFGLLMIQPVNLGVYKHGTSTYGKLDRHILRVWRMAYRAAQKPFSEVKDHAIFHGRSPSLFKFVAELSARAGASNPIPLQIIYLILVIAGIIAQYTWLKMYFKNDVFPVISCLFVLGSQWLTYFGINIHQKPYDFAFFNFCMYFMVRHVQSKQIKYYIFAWLSYLVLCQNYYMFWISAFIMMVGIQFFAGTQIISLKNFILGMAPILTIISVILQLSYAHGSFEKGMAKIKEAAKARSFNQVEGSKSFEDKMDKKDWLSYPLTISARVERYFYVPGFAFIFLAWILARLKRANNSQLNYKFFWFLVPAGLSWYFVMVQHTAVHQVAGRYSFFLWMIFYGYFFTELKTYIDRNFPAKRLQKWAQYAGVFVIIYGVYGFGYVNAYTLVMNSVRYVDFKQTESRAYEGDVEAQLDLLSNMHTYAYRYYGHGWLDALSGEEKVVQPGLTLVKFLVGKEAGYLVLKTSKYFSNNNKLYINGKFFDLSNPNEEMRQWHRRKYVILKFPGLTKLESLEIR